MEGKRNALKREFIKSMLSEKSVCYANDLAGMLIALIDDSFSGVDELEKKVSDKYDKMRKNYNAKIDELKGVKKEEPTEVVEEAVEDVPEELPSVAEAENEEAQAEGTKEEA